MARRVEDPDFNRLRDSYPRREKIGDARKVYRRMKSKGLLPPVDELLADIVRRKKSSQWNQKCYIPLLSNYLEGERWEDENLEEVYEPKRSAAGKTKAELAKDYYRNLT